MTSLKNLIAGVAVSLPLLASAQQAAAPAPLYQLYGTFNVNGQWTEATRPWNIGAGTTSVASRFGVSIDSTNVGIRGTADTGQFGLGVVYQCETAAAVDGIAPAGICGRNSRLGLTGNWGTLFYGNWDTPYKAAWYGTKADDAFGNTDVYDAAGIMASPGFKTKATAGASAGPSGTFSSTNFATSSLTFAIRAANSIAYHSPNIQGLQIKAQVSTNEWTSNDGRVSPTLASVSANYDRGPLSVLAAYERHWDYFGLDQLGNNGTAITPVAGAAGNKSAVDYAWKVGAGYELGSPFGTTTLGAVFEQLNYGYANNQGLVDGDVKSVSRSAFMINAKHRMGNHEFRARYELANPLDAKYVGAADPAVETATQGSGAVNYALGYAYYLNKATQLYAYYTKIENERRATYTFSTAGVSAVTSNFTGGADPMAIGLGMRYAF